MLPDAQDDVAKVGMDQYIFHSCLQMSTKPAVSAPRLKESRMPVTPVAFAVSLNPPYPLHGHLRYSPLLRRHLLCPPFPSYPFFSPSPEG